MSNEPEPIAPAARPAGDSATSLVLLPEADERQDGWTPERQARFLRELGATHCVSTAARAAGMSRQSAYKLRNRLRGEPFDIAWQAAFRRQYDALAEAVVERAIHGVEVPHFYKGELIHTSRRYDERAAVTLLALRERFSLALTPRCWRADEEGVNPDDFEALVLRVEEGDELWGEIEYIADDGDTADEVDRDGGDAAE